MALQPPLNDPKGSEDQEWHVTFFWRILYVTLTFHSEFCPSWSDLWLDEALLKSQIQFHQM